MVTILGVRLRKHNRFISIRWKLVSTYLLLLIISLIIINGFISKTILNIYLEQKRSDLLTRANIISNNIKYHIDADINTPTENFLQITLENFSKSIGARIIVTDENKRVIGDSNREFIGDVFTHDEIAKALSGITSYKAYNFREIGHVLYLSVPISFGDKIVGATLISTSIDDIYNTVGEINRSLVLISFSSIFFILIISFVLVSIISRPIESFTKSIIRMSRGNLDERLEINTNDEFKKMGDAFNIMAMKLDQVDKQRKEFVANVSHELRTPLSSIKLLSESLIHQNEDNIMIYREFLKDIDSEIDRLNNIIDDLLSLVDMDKEKLTINYKTTYVNYLLEKIVTRLKPLADKKSIGLSFISGERIQIKMDTEKMQQALINIIHNAIKYTPDGGQVKIRLYSQGRFTIIKIKDNGIGIPKESLHHIFDRFYRVDKARSRNTGGTGLGLAIAKQVVNLHQGDIIVESEVGKGSIFYVKIPNIID